MAPLVSKTDLNKLRRDMHNEVTLICAKCRKDLFNISKVKDRKTKWPRFFGLPCMWLCAANFNGKLLIILSVDGN